MSEPGRDRDGADGAAPTRCGFVAILGATNSGKSTLVNALVGTKVSIVSRKVQTTRAPVRGIALEGPAQIVFIDTPGIFEPRRRLDKAMVEAAWTGAEDTDAVILLVDAERGITEDVERIVGRLAGRQKAKRVLVLNKVDRVREKPRLLTLANDLSARLEPDAVFMVSALDGSGLAELRRYLADAMPAGPWLYPEDEVTDVPLRLLAAEITRERILNWLHQELPYATTVETTSWKDLKNGSVRIEQTIFVERESQRRIVLGKGGEMVKRISSEARKEIAGIVEKPVHLFLFVKVREDWGSDPERYREMGLRFPKD